MDIYLYVENISTFLQNPSSFQVLTKYSGGELLQTCKRIYKDEGQLMEYTHTHTRERKTQHQQNDNSTNSNNNV